MKSILLITLILVSACGGKIEKSPSDFVGRVRSTSPVALEASDLAKVTSICEALEDKIVSTLVNQTYVFDFSQKDCDDSSFGPSVPQTVTLTSTIAGFKFMANGTPFYFHEIETLEQGSMSGICGNLGVSPIRSGNDLIYYSTEGISSTDCSVNSDEVCIELSKAREISESQSKEHTREWIRFRVNNNQGRLGFFTYKKILSTADCPENQDIGRIATLK